MEFKSIEEKVIYNKLTAGRTQSASPESSNLKVISLDSVPQLISKIDGCLNSMGQLQHNTSYRPLMSSRRTIGRLVVFAKKVMRRLAFWYIEPICEQQTAFNQAVTSSIVHVTEINTALLERVLLLTSEQESFRNSQNILEEQSKKLEEIQQQLKEEHVQHTAKQLETEKLLQLAREQIVNLRSELDEIEQQKFSNNSEFDETVFKTMPRSGRYSHSQAGEDVIIHFLLIHLAHKDITYLDIGANHADFLSNTFFFYKLGIRGVLIEANPVLIPELEFYRLGDTILNLCVTEKSGDVVDFYIMSGDGLSTTSKESAEEFISKNPELSIVDVVSVETISINDVIENYMGKAPTILNIDIEGSEMEILRSADFEKFRPLVIVIEMIPYMKPYSVTKRNRSILDFLDEKGYYEYAFTGINSIFVDSQYLKDIGRFFI